MVAVITMAKLLSYFNLCPIMDANDLLGVAEDKEEGTIINTLGKNMIIIIKVRPVACDCIRIWHVIEILFPSS